MTNSKPQKDSKLKSTEHSTESALEAVTLRLRNLELKLDEKDCELDDIHERLESTELDLEGARAALRDANPEKVFVVLKFRNPKQLLGGGAYRLFILQQKTLKSKLRQFKTKFPDLDAVKMDELQLGPSHRGESVYQHMRDDDDAPIKFSRKNFVRKEDCTEEQMIEYILRVYNTHTREE